LDGTTNFVHGYPNVGVSIALQIDGRLEAACVIDVMRDEVFCAQAGAGATCNGAPIHVSTVSDIGQALFVTGFPYDRVERVDFYLPYFRAFLVAGHGVRRGGAAALDLAMIAAGRADGFWEFGLSPWDVAAGALLIEEAGGAITGLEGEGLRLDAGRTLASNGRLQSAMSALIAKVSAERGT
jgi:myo-inositol-1(or 4)-monophosphatase